MSTSFHAKYFAHELTKRCPSDSLEKLTASLADAQVDLNPHQIDAALFAFRSPLSKGAILADEVGLGKTIEAGILLSQKWAERKRKLLIIVPANLRKQWNQELADKFFLPSQILETRSFNDQIKRSNLNPFDQSEIIICSYNFARAKDVYIPQVKWDLVIIDEAHRLRNVYKPANRIANAIKVAVAPFHKVLLTATPLQNSLLELYGLVSIIDDHTFGDLKSFKTQFANLRNPEDFAQLKERLRPICQRTLRRQVLEYVPYTNRKAIVQEFFPSAEEQKLYDLVSDYLQRPNLFALPASQRQLMTLILRKLLASSTYAISGTLEALSSKLEAIPKAQAPVELKPDEVASDYEAVDETEEEWNDDGDAHTEEKKYTFEELEHVGEEAKTLRGFEALARSIIKNSKGEVLLTALKKGFVAATEKGARKKAIIFTESRRTQEYLRELLEKTEYAGKVVLFNGSNTDAKSKEIYRDWLKRHEGTDWITGSPSADIRAALVDYFRDSAIVMIATEAAAEGINLQFCSLVVNYDLPWNPQRIEQRIGRCHRYGQKSDVVVVNFLNKANAADVRIYQLLDEKFKLFNGVFGASDEVLGAIESGVDFERRISEIYQTCRTPEQIEFNFNELQEELEQQIDEAMQQTRQKLLENFDEEVQEKLKLTVGESRDYLGKFDNWLWQLTRYYLKPVAESATRRVGLSGTGRLTPARTLWLLREHLDTRWLLDSRTIDRLDRQTVVDELLRVKMSPAAFKDRLPLPSEVCLDIWRGLMAQEEDARKIPAILSAAVRDLDLTSTEVGVSELEILELAESAVDTSTAKSGDLAVWISHRKDKIIGSLVQRALSEKAIKRASERSPGWQRDYLAFADTSEAVALGRLALDRIELEQMVDVCLQEIRTAGTLDQEAGQWFARLADSPLRNEISLGKKLAISEITHKGWQSLQALWRLYQGDKQNSRWHTESGSVEREALLKELREMITEFPPNTFVPNLQGLVELLGQLPEEDIQAFAKLKPRLSQRNADKWLQGWQALGCDYIYREEKFRLLLEQQEPVADSYIPDRFEISQLGQHVDELLFEGETLDDERCRSELERSLTLIKKNAVLRVVVENLVSSVDETEEKWRIFRRRFATKATAMNLLFEFLPQTKQDQIIAHLARYDLDQFRSAAGAVYQSTHESQFALEPYSHAVLRFLLTSAGEVLRREIGVDSHGFLKAGTIDRRLRELLGDSSGKEAESESRRKHAKIEGGSEQLPTSAESSPRHSISNLLKRLGPKRVRAFWASRHLHEEETEDIISEQTPAERKSE